MNGEASKATTAMVMIAARQPARSRPPSRPIASTATSPIAVPAPGGGASRMNASAITTARNETALAANAVGYPNAATVAPGERRPDDPTEVELRRAQRDRREEL